MKSPMLLFDTVLEELGLLSGVDTTMDKKTAHRRFEHEGESFLTIQLPKLRKNFELSLELREFQRHLDIPFGVRGRVPVFLRGFFSLVFDEKTGVLLDNVDVEAVRAIRQITGLYGSYFEVCDDRRVRKALKGFVETDREVGTIAKSLSDEAIAQFKRSLNDLFGGMLSRVENAVYQGSLLPRHSGGATADRLLGNAKWTLPEWTERLEEVFPYFHYAVANPRLAIHKLGEDGTVPIRFRSVDEEIPVRVIPVPKTHDKPRIISIEPSYMQYMQQGVSRELMRGLERDHYAHVQLRRREHNQEAARYGSLTGTLATVDLKDASDRLSWRLVKEGFSSYPWLVQAMDACRTRRAAVDELGEIYLNKFASMGSGLTFPVQTIVFMTLAYMGMAKATNTSVRSLISKTPWVRVFGDDIVIPSATLPLVRETLEAYGLIVNTGKTFWNGKFRESCGGEYYNGQDVSFVKVRHRMPLNRRDALAVASAVSLRNRFYKVGLWQTVRLLDNYLGSILKYYPDVDEQSPILGRVTSLPVTGDGFHPAYQTPTVKGYLVVNKIPKNRIDGHDALLRWFTENEQTSFQDLFTEKSVFDFGRGQNDRFERSGRPERVALKLGEVPL